MNHPIPANFRASTATENTKVFCAKCEKEIGFCIGNGSDKIVLSNYRINPMWIFFDDLKTN